MANRYSLARKISNFIYDLSDKYNLIHNPEGINVKIEFEKHLCDRILDRSIPKEVFEKFLTRLCRNKICEVLYFIELDNNKRVSLKTKDGYLLGLTGNKTQNGNYQLKVRTLYKERNADTRNRTISTNEIYID